MKAKYRRLAAKERMNFEDAFPGYKFVSKKGRLLRKRARGQPQTGPAQDDKPTENVLSDGYDNQTIMCVEGRRSYLAAQDLSGAPHPDLLLLPHESAALTHYVLQDHVEPQPAYYNNPSLKPPGGSFGSTAYGESYGEAWVTANPKALLLDPLDVPEWTFWYDCWSPTNSYSTARKGPPINWVSGPMASLQRNGLDELQPPPLHTSQ